jgi:drug/metabolite transporter (DMT)-like permease
MPSPTVAPPATLLRSPDPTLLSAGRAYVLLTLTTLTWGAHTVIGRLAVGQVSPVALVTLRWLCVALLLGVFTRRKLRAEWPGVRSHLPFLLVMGALGFGLYNALYYSAAHFTTAVNMGIVQGAIPVFVALFAFAVDRTRVNPGQVLGILASLLGVLVVASSGNPLQILQLKFNPGDLMMVCGCALYAGYIVALRRGPAVSAFTTLTVLASGAFTASLPLLAAEWAYGSLQPPTLRGAAIVLVVAIFPSLLAQAWFIQGVRQIGPGRAGVFVNLVPVFSALMGVTFLAESFAAFHAVALALVLGGIWLSERQGRPGASS